MQNSGIGRVDELPAKKSLLPRCDACERYGKGRKILRSVAMLSLIRAPVALDAFLD